jgi:hypothetical protein
VSPGRARNTSAAMALSVPWPTAQTLAIPIEGAPLRR